MTNLCLRLAFAQFQVSKKLCTNPIGLNILYKTLKHSQYKNDAIQFKNFLVLKLPPFFPACVAT